MPSVGEQRCLPPPIAPCTYFRPLLQLLSLDALFQFCLSYIENMCTLGEILDKSQTQRLLTIALRHKPPTSITMKKIALLLFTAWAVSATHAQDLGQKIPVDTSFIKGRLSNGLTYYIRHNEKPEDKLVLRLVVDAGSILETDKQQGLAHYLEHMAFNGTKHFPKNELVSYLESVGLEFGSDLNAHTGFDETVFMLPIPTDDDSLVNSAFTVLSDWTQNMNLKTDDIHAELGVILSEKRSRGNNAQERIRDKLFPILFSGSHYKDRLPIGKVSILKTFDPNELRAFYKKWYRPDLCAVIAVGDYDVKRIENEIKSRFGNWKAPRDEAERKYYPVPDNKGTLFGVAIDKELSNTVLEIECKKPRDTMRTVGDFKRSILRDAYTTSLNQRLDEIRQKKDAPFIYASNGFDSMTRTKDSYKVVALASEGKIERAFKGLYREIRRMKAFGLTQAELDRYKKDYLKGIDKRYAERNKTSSNHYVAESQRNFLSESPLFSIADGKKLAYQIVPGITLSEVDKIGADTYTSENRIVLITGPEKEGLRYPNEDTFLRWEREVDREVLKPYREEVKTTPLFTQIDKPGTIVKEKRNKKFDFTELKLSNGVKVFLKSTNFKNDAISLYGFSKGGSSLLNDSQAFSAVYLNGLISKSGLGDRNHTQFQRDLAGKNAQVRLNLGQMEETISGSSSVKDFETLLKMVHDYFSRVNFDEETFASFIAAQKSLSENQLKVPGTFFNNEISKILTQNHPRRSRVYTPQEIDSVSFDDIKQAYKERFATGAFHFFLVGNIDIEKSKPLIAKYLGSLPNLNRGEKGKDLGIRPPKGRVEKKIYYGTEKKARTLLYFTRAEAYSEREDEIINTLGKLVEIRLLAVLREKMGGVYSPYVDGGMDREPYPNYRFVIYFDSDLARADTLVQTTWNILHKIKSGAIKSEDLEKVKAEKLQNLKESQEKNEYWMDQLVDADYYGERMEIYKKQQKLIQSVTPKDLIKAARKVFDRDAYIEIMLLPESAKK